MNLSIHSFPVWWISNWYWKVAPNLGLLYGILKRNEKGKRRKKEKWDLFDLIGKIIFWIEILYWEKKWLGYLLGVPGWFLFFFCAEAAWAVDEILVGVEECCCFIWLWSSNSLFPKTCAEEEEAAAIFSFVFADEEDEEGFILFFFFLIFFYFFSSLWVSLLPFFSSIWSYTWILETSTAKHANWVFFSLKSYPKKKKKNIKKRGK